MASKANTALVPSSSAIGPHIRRLIQKTLGATDEAISKAEGVSVEVVKRSIRVAEIYREEHSLDAVNLVVGQTVTGLSVDVQKALRNSLQAKKGVKRYVRRKGKVHERMVQVADHETQLKAVGEYRGLVLAIQPKGGGVNVTNNATATANAAAFSEANYQPGVEEMIDKIRSKVEQQNTVPRELGTIKDDDADIIEGDPSDVSADSEDGASDEEEQRPPEPAEPSP